MLMQIFLVSSFIITGFSFLLAFISGKEKIEKRYKNHILATKTRGNDKSIHYGTLPQLVELLTQKGIHNVSFNENLLRYNSDKFTIRERDDFSIEVIEKDLVYIEKIAKQVSEDGSVHLIVMERGKIEKQLSKEYFTFPSAKEYSDFVKWKNNFYKRLVEFKKKEEKASASSRISSDLRAKYFLLDETGKKFHNMSADELDKFISKHTEETIKELAYEPR